MLSGRRRRADICWPLAARPLGTRSVPLAQSAGAPVGFARLRLLFAFRIRSHQHSGRFDGPSHRSVFELHQNCKSNRPGLEHVAAKMSLRCSLRCYTDDADVFTVW